MIGDTKLVVVVEGEPDELLGHLQGSPFLSKVEIAVAVPDGRPAKLEWYHLPEVTSDNLPDIERSIGLLSRRLGTENVKQLRKYAKELFDLVAVSKRRRQSDLARIASRVLGEADRDWLEGNYWRKCSRREAAQDRFAFEALVLELEKTKVDVRDKER